MTINIPTTLSSSATYFVDMRSKEEIKRDEREKKIEDIKLIKLHIRDLKKLPLTLNLNNIGVYHKYWQEYHCCWNYEDYNEDFSFKIFLKKVKKGYKKQQIEKLTKQLLTKT